MTATSLMGNWRRMYDHVNQGCKWTGGGTAGCGAANPSALGTHWFKTSCSLGGPTLSDGFFLATARGKYFNWDFGLNTLRTDVDTWVELSLNPGTGVSWNFTHTATGEFSFLLTGHLNISSGSNTCF